MKRKPFIPFVLLLVLGLTNSACNLPSYSTPEWGVFWNRPGLTLDWDYLFSEGALVDGEIVFVGDRHLIAAVVRDLDPNRLPNRITVYINGGGTSFGISTFGTTGTQFTTPWTPAATGIYMMQVQVFRPNDTQSVTTTVLHVCAVNRNDATVAAATAVANGAVAAVPDCALVAPSGAALTPVATSSLTPRPTLIAPTPRPAHHNSNGTCSEPPQGCFPYSWLQAQCQCGIP